MKEISLTQGKVALVDDEDFDFLNQHKWCVKVYKNRHYAVFGVLSGGAVTIFKMHRLILGLTDPKIKVDHRDGNGLNNCRNNIRIATYSQNNANKTAKINGSSKYLGVCWSKTKKKWEVKICKNYKRKHIGRFDNEIDAAIAYNLAALEIHGEFANLNDVGKFKSL